MNIDNQVNQIVQQVIQDITSKIQQQVMETVAKQIKEITDRMDYYSIFQASMTTAIKERQLVFPDRSIPGSAINRDNFVLTGDSITGGIIKNFGSTGIDDQSTACQLSIFDEVTVIENNLLTKDLTVKGTATIEGDLIVTGKIPESSEMFKQIVRTATNNVRTSLDQVVFQNYADMVLNTIKRDGLDLTKITVNGKSVIDGGNLDNSITYSNLQHVGLLQDLQVKGESLLSESLYTTKGRVGINTTEPAQAFSVWDQEVEFGIGKQGNNTAIMGLPRSQTLVISTNGKDNLVLTPDGGVAVQKIKLDSMMISCADMPPSSSQPRGTLVFNSNPTLGGPLGWVSLGDAKWANFGYID